MYPFYCILPYGHFLIYQDDMNGGASLLQPPLQSSEVPSCYNSTIMIITSTNDIREVQLLQLGEYFGFEYSSHLQYLHESALRNYYHWGIDRDASLINTITDAEISTIDQKLTFGAIHPDIYLKEIGEINGINVGYGVFASSHIGKNEYIGEYVGVVMESSTASTSSYCLNYPSADKSYVINAREIGNIIRFVNHSSNPNASFQPYIYEGIVHVLCISIREIEDNEQITVNYGNSYWLHQEHQALDLF